MYFLSSFSPYYCLNCILAKKVKSSLFVNSKEKKIFFFIYIICDLISMEVLGRKISYFNIYWELFK